MDKPLSDSLAIMNGDNKVTYVHGERWSYMDTGGDPGKFTIELAGNQLTINLLSGITIEEFRLEVERFIDEQFQKHGTIEEVEFKEKANEDDNRR